jgi:hypothetical protein
LIVLYETISISSLPNVSSFNSGPRKDLVYIKLENITTSGNISDY